MNLLAAEVLTQPETWLAVVEEMGQGDGIYNLNDAGGRLEVTQLVCRALYRIANRERWADEPPSPHLTDEDAAAMAHAWAVENGVWPATVQLDPGDVAAMRADGWVCDCGGMNGFHTQDCGAVDTDVSRTDVSRDPEPPATQRVGPDR